MIDLLALLSGLGVGVALGSIVLAARRGRPVRTAAPVAAAQPTPARPAAPPRPQVASPGSAGGHDIRVNPPPAPPAPAPRATATAAHLELDDGSRRIVLGDEPVTIGRGQDQVVRIADPRASRAHAVVRRRAKGGWEVADAGSANGTTLNGHAIPEGRVAPLRDGDRIGVGPAVIHYREGGGGERPAPRPGPDATQVLP